MFKRKKEVPKLPLPKTQTNYPVGSFIETEKGFYYILKPDKRLKITSERVLSSWYPARVIKTTEAAVSTYKVLAKMKFRDNTLIKNIADGKVYLIESKLRRHIVSPDVFLRIGVNPSEVDKYAILASQEEVDLHEIGDILN